MDEQLQLGETDELASLRRAWDAALELISGEVSRPSFESFFRTARPIAANDGRATIAATGELARIFLEKHSEMLKTAVSSCMSRDVELTFVVKPAEEPKPRAEQTGRARPTTGALSPVSMPLNEKYTFANFVTGPSNRMAQAAAQAIADRPGKKYNPFFLYGGPGLGKTHLLQAIGRHVLAAHPRLRVAYVSGECFTSHYVNALREHRSEEFRRKYRNVDVWLVDDIQFLVGRERTKEEFFHTFNALHQADKQIVLSSDRSPRDLNPIEERLISRFQSGLVAEIAPPDLETRIAILQCKAASESADVPDPVLECVANLIPTNVRALEGALVTLLAYTSLMKAPLTLPTVKEVLGRYISEKKCTELSPDTVVRAVAHQFHIDEADLRGQRRQKELVTARHIAMYLIRELTDYPLQAIGKAFDGRDHATVLHACGRVKDILAGESELKQTVEQLMTDLRSGRS